MAKNQKNGENPDDKNNKDPNKKPPLSSFFKYAAYGTFGAILYTIFANNQDIEVTPQGETLNNRQTHSRIQERPQMRNRAPLDQRYQSKLRLDSEFWDLLKNGNLEAIRVTGTNDQTSLLVTGNLQQTGRGFAFITREKDRLYKTLEANRTPFIEDLGPSPQATTVVQQKSGGGSIFSTITTVLFLGIGIFLVYNIIKQMRGQGGAGIGGFGKSKAKLLTQDDQIATFADVAGVEEAKEELMEVVDFLTNPSKYATLGAKLPKGALLVGPPGTGKTLMARAVAGEAGVPFFMTSGSAFVEMFVGVGASRIRDMFEQAKKNAPCIIFIDEIDAIGKKRDSGAGAGGNDEREQTLNQLLVEMDGFEGNSGVIIMAATNRPEILDAALMRPGRFDRKVNVPLPVFEGRQKILEVHLQNINANNDIDIKLLASATPGFSGADLANLVNEAALHAARENKKVVTMKHFEEAKDKIMMGTKYKTSILDDDEKKKTAYHEIGHALVGLKTSPPADPLYKVTCIPRGRSLGVTINTPEKDQISLSEAQLKSRLAMMFGGRLAEEIIYGKEHVTTGAANDIQQATNLARRMVTEWGYSEKVGRIRHISEQSNPFGMGGGFADASKSPETQKLIDDEVKNLIDEAQTTAKNILESNKEDLEILSEVLFTYEELSGAQVEYVLQHKEAPQELKDLLKLNPQVKRSNDNTDTDDIPPYPARTRHNEPKI